MLDYPGLRRAYGMAHFGKSLLWHTSQLLFAYFLTEAAGFSPQAMGVILAAALLLNATTDLIVGKALARRTTSLASATRVQLRGAILAGSSLLLLAVSAQVTGRAQPVLAALALGLFATAYAFVDVPQNALLGIATWSERERVRLSAVRLILSGCAQLLVVCAFVPLMRGVDRAALGAHFLLFSGALAATAIASAALLRRAGAKDPQPGYLATATSAAAPPTAVPTLAALLAMMGVFSLVTTSVVKVEPYVASYWFRSAADSAAFMIGIAVGGIVAQPLWSARTSCQSHEMILREAAAVLAIGGLSFQLAAYGPVAAALAGLIYGAGQGGLAMLLWSFVAGIAQQCPGKATACFGAFTFVAKAAGALSALLLSHALQASAYRAAGADLSILVGMLIWLPALGAAALLIIPAALRARPARREQYQWRP